MAKTVYLDERGDDKNDGLSEATPVLGGDRAIKISIKVQTRQFHIKGSDAYVRRMNAELEEKRLINTVSTQ
jgi:hypothetical protein